MNKLTYIEYADIVDDICLDACGQIPDDDFITECMDKDQDPDDCASSFIVDNLCDTFEDDDDLEF